ncbi:phosphate ABC transporter membrane protein 2, PhoT family (TC 3.A.1.7.1) [Streptomyces sp. ScaeMP-e48]|uniref:phosphate ABC transporter permease subunit PstC n=1 Tax=Streptomyces TaxID=1883 RepID=UPI000823C02B|nr:phosphate ABC transporter permease subunit PstC [Streptomyces sp. ScaeMP-e48]SCK34975.1 phosphate ABC transporter membrane protein 2, PhoT family (TC 3.A.1.7.1) [Streptomyces sp. ScaeMP-e48]
MTITEEKRPAAEPGAQPRPRRSAWVWGWLFTGAFSVVAVLLALLGYLGEGVAGGDVDWAGLLTESSWNPSGSVFGGLAMIYGSAVVCVIALVLAVPVGWGAAVALSEYVPGRAARALRMSVELLAAVPSIVYGLIGILLIRPFVGSIADVPGGDSLLAAGMVLAVMIMPTIVAVSVDSLAAVPDRDREAAFSLGLTRREVIRSAVLPKARAGMRAAVLLGLARALGEAIAVFLVVGRADGRLPGTLDQLLNSLVRPGQTLTTKLAGPEPVLAGTSGTYFASLCGLGLVLLALVAMATVWGNRGASRPVRVARFRGRRSAGRSRVQVDRFVAALRLSALALPVLLLLGMFAVLATRGSAAFDPSFWFTSATGAAGGGVSDQILGTLLLVVTCGLIALPLGFGAGVLLGVHASARTARVLQTLTVVVGGTPTVLLGLAGFVIFCSAMGWGRSWLAGAFVLVPVVVPMVALPTCARVRSLSPEMTESALSLGLTRAQYIRSVVVPYTWPATLTGLLLGLARAAGETAPLLFTATVFFGAPALPGGIVESPVQALPTHIFTLSQDSGDPQAVAQAWGSAMVLVLITAVLLSLAVALRNRFEGERWTT